MHPKELGFTLELSFNVAADECLTRGFVSERARQAGALLYVAWLTPAGRALKVGISGKSLWARWTKVIRNMEKPLDRLLSLRPNEVRDREKLLRNARGQEVELWMIPFPLPQDSRFAGQVEGMSLRSAEAYLDRKYAPLFGQPLGPRDPWLASGSQEPEGYPLPGKPPLGVSTKEHAKLRSSSDGVRGTCEAICTLLRELGFDIGRVDHRDGFSLIASNGLSVRVDPKREWLRLRVKGLQRPPENLVHHGRQPEWLVVTPDHLESALAYLRLEFG